MTQPPLAEPVYFLLIDDLDENLLALDALLRRPGLVLLKARSGIEALELLLKHEIALALVDIQMPVMDGFELAELMRGSERTRRVPIIFLTAGHADRHRRFRGYEAGAVDFLQKPLEPDILRSKAEVFFDLYRQRQEVAQQRDELKAATIENARLLKETREYAEALQRADQRKDDFLAMLAHELRNPLGPVRNAVEIMKLGTPTQETITQARDIISRQVTHMARLVDDLLDVARIARGKVQLRTISCNLADIVRQTAEDYRLTLSDAGIELTVTVPDTPLVINGDPIRLAQVVGNLLHNACKFTPAGGHVEVQAMQAPSEDVAIATVRDTGAGLDETVKSRLFEPFSQADQALDRDKGGLGLGLALVRGLVELHGGSVNAESDGPGTGSTFLLQLPLLTSDHHSGDTVPKATQDAPAGLRILLIEDNRDAALTLQMLLSLQGHEVRIGFDGPEGLTTARSFRPHVVISDLGLPGELDGYAVASALREDPSLPPIYLIALSGYGQDDDRQRAANAGFDRHLVKPVDPQSLREALSAATAIRA